MKTLVICDDYWHPARVPREGIGQLGDTRIEFDFLEDAHEWSAERMAEYPLVILTKSNNVSSGDKTRWMSDEVQVAFANYVRKGNALLVIHSGTADYKDCAVLRSLIGGVFDMHPPQCEVSIQPQAPHTLTANVEPFTIKDEHYFMLFDAPDADVFLTTQSAHGTQPGGWMRREGEGRVCVITPGHNVEVWLHPSFQQLLRNSIGELLSAKPPE